MLVVGKPRGSRGDQEIEKACGRRRTKTTVTGKNSCNEAASNIKESNSCNYVD
jgi:hypothetical protein